MSPGLLLLILRIMMGAALIVFLVVILLILRQDLHRNKTQPTFIPSARLILTSGSSGKKIFELSNLDLIGRAADNTIVLNEEAVSAHHARLSYLSGWQWWLEDLGSRNGTSVNSIPVEQPLAVTNGDEIAFGTVVCELVVEGSDKGPVSTPESDQIKSIL
jgi:pSer/pThr/pTyr-binding forkhead associated (FHA) protein